MKNSHKLAVAVTIGIVMGVAGGWLYFRQMLSEHVLDSTSGKIIDAVDTLRLVRKGDLARLIEEREEDMAIYIATLSQLQTVASLSERQVKVLLAADRYYGDFPASSSDSNRNAQVASFLVEVRAQRKGVTH